MLRGTLPAIGPVKKRWAAWRRQQAEVVRARSCGLCEGCGKDGRPLRVAHLMGRRNLVAEPWASWAGLCAHLCSAHPSYGLGCHEQVDQRKDLLLRNRLLRQAADRLVFREHEGEKQFTVTMALVAPEFAPDDIIRGIVRRLEAAGIDPSGTLSGPLKEGE